MPDLIRRIATALDRISLGNISLDDQYRTPRGLMGLLVGQDMLRQHAPEIHWTFSLLKLCGTEQVLEIGSGPGLLLGKMAREMKTGRVFGLDVSDSMVNLSRWRNLMQVLGGQLRVQEGDAAALPYSAHQFDCIVSVHCLYFWQDPLRVLQECLRVLKPEGKLVLTFMPKRRWPNGGVGSTCQVFSEEELVELILQAGFSGAEVVSGETHFRECAVIARP
ncbi:class I SAM-dependent methyltransferase [Deinococcus roseus]|uniref:Methyltransferase type 11 domain-containing protein n=1 Tax=Deinococcus roseus TaxID=392414 RepID=A0ABQ2CY91_9DEIO|nr:class I SAM-dependent methyltransferase [Deinococcus roseus]GGJ32659.1 hypothetical protein GCM10008938_18620 [Deinococcus roseus]